MASKMLGEVISWSTKCNDNDRYRHDAQVKDLERLLGDAERERREVREKYMALGRRCEALQGSEEAARYGLQVSRAPANCCLRPP